VFQGCRKLEPGHLLTWRDSEISTRRWWFPERAPAAPGATIRELFQDAVRIRLRADVPVALSLSGGVDSSVIAAECVAQDASPEAFTISFDGDETDLTYARLAAQHLGLQHSVIPAAADSFTSVLAAYDEPFADSSAIPCLALGRALAGRYKAVLHGDGGDEAFGGYRHYEFIAAKQRIKAAAAVARVVDGHGTGGVGLYVESKVAFRGAERVALLNRHSPGTSFAERLGASEFLRTAPRAPLHRAMWTDRHLHLSNGLTYKTDIALGAHGIEGRAPFLDHRIFEWTQTLPARDLVRGREKKFLLRAAYRGILPGEILDRPKHGFGAPVDRWLAGTFAPLVRDLLPCPLLGERRQRGLSGQRLWALFIFAAWARKWSARW
jgi:asparagine synthase (glutamine-hydrolysing)